jgi:hypothetical protein
MGIAVIACIGASAMFAFEFGWTRGATLVAHWTYAVAGVALDLFKSGLPILGATAWHDSKPAQSLACWVVFIVLTGLSLWCAYGTTATQLAEKFASQAVAQSDLSTRQTALDRLRGQRDGLKFTETSEEAVRTAEATVTTATEQAAAERARGGCKDICRQREAEERDARAALLLAQQNRAATIKAAALDARLAVAEAALNDVDKKEAVKDADPQSASMAKAIGADQSLIAALSMAFFAIAIEFGSGVGFWLVFGHGGPRPRAEVHPPPSSTELVPVDPPQKLIPIDEKPADIVERFFLEVVRPALNRRVRSLVMWEAFRMWRADRSIDVAVSHAMFGRLARWQKGRIGGAVWYLDCELAEGYGAHELKALPRPQLIGGVTGHSLICPSSLGADALSSE